MFRAISLFIFLIFLFVQAKAQLTIQVTSIPSNSPVGDDIFVAGNFNNWAEGDPNFIMSNNGENTFSLTVDPAIGWVEFKFTRGSWATVEGNESGGYQSNHTFYYDGNASEVQVPILSWEDLGSGGNGPSTATDNVLLLDDDFYIPQLNRYRKIWIYLPPGYSNSNQNYPVIYMQDGQNLFDAYTSFSGEWEVDESMNTLFGFGDSGAIIVGINNGGADRIEEYTPWPHPSYGGGGADLFVDFIVETLKPYIDTNFRTRADRHNTGIMGSSLGGLLAMYAAIEHQEVFGKAGVFSPSFWFTDQIYTHVSNTGKEADMKFYLMASEQEDDGSVVDHIETMNTTLLNAGFHPWEINLHIHQDGAHSEWFWAREYPDAYWWLFGNITTSTNNMLSKPKPTASISSNLIRNVLHVQLKEPGIEAVLHIHNLNGQKVKEEPLHYGDQQISLQELPDSMYILNVFHRQQVLYTEKIILHR